jgi:hypothetical protein
MHVVRCEREGRSVYLVWDEAGGDALLVDWDGVVQELAAVVERERLRPAWHARTDARRLEDAGPAGARLAAELAAAYPRLRTAWYAGCGTLRVGGLRIDVLWTPRDGGVAGLSFVVDEKAAFTGALQAAAEARDERAARSLEVVREYAALAELHPGA